MQVREMLVFESASTLAHITNNHLLPKSVHVKDCAHTYITAPTLDKTISRISQGSRHGSSTHKFEAGRNLS
jgi:hypothetical protein